MDKISRHVIKRHNSKMKKDLKMVLLSNIMSIATLSELSGVKKCVYESAISGHPIRYENAVAICKALKISYKEYFEDIETQKEYVKESIKKHRNVLSAILADTKKLGLIEDNYASPDYLEPIRGFKEEVKILN